MKETRIPKTNQGIRMVGFRGIIQIKKRKDWTFVAYRVCKVLKCIKIFSIKSRLNKKLQKLIDLKRVRNVIFLCQNLKALEKRAKIVDKYSMRPSRKKA
jgi:hypothetical protein